MITLIHLSDSHFESVDKCYFETVEGISKALREVEKISKIVIMFTGDISNSGKKEEYAIAKQVLDNLRKNLTEEFNLNLPIDVFVVPGNHDIDFMNQTMSRTEVKELMNTDIIEAQSTFIRKMKEFYNFSNEYDCFVDDPFVDIKTLSFQNKVFKFYLLNSGLFSIYEKKASDNDAGLHYMPEAALKIFKESNSEDYNFCLVHHSINMFEEKVHNSLTDIFSDKIDVLYYGHEHKNKIEKTELNGDYEINYKLGKALFKDSKSGFGVTQVNPDTGINKSYSFEWNHDNQLFSMDSDDFAISFKHHINENIRKEFIENILKCDDLFAGGTLNNLFVFPYLELVEYGNDGKKKKIDSFEALNSMFEHKKICYIEGDDSCGRTTLAKYLFYRFSMKYVPLLVSIKSVDKKNWQNSFKEAINTQYKNNKYSYFVQSEVKKKVIIIDDIHLIDKDFLEQIINNVKDKFHRILLLSNSKTEYNYIDILKTGIVQDKETFRLQVKPMLFRKRQELISNAILIREPLKSKKELKIMIDSILKNISKSLNIINLNPTFLLMFLNLYLNGNVLFGESGVFNSLFESQILTLINSGTKSNKKISESNTILLLHSLISLEAMRGKQYPITQKLITSVIDNYNSKSSVYRNKVNPNEFINQMVEAKVFKYINSVGDIIYSQNSYLSYFIAKGLMKEFINQRYDDINKIVKNICFGINSDIVLFLSYLFEDTKLLNMILEESEHYFSDLDELVLESKPDSFVLGRAEPVVSNEPTSSEIENAKDEMEKQEEIITEEILKVKQIFDYDESTIDDAINKYIRGLKYIEIISKALPDFISNMNDDEEILRFIKSVYAYPSKVTKFVFNQIEEILQYEDNEIAAEFDLKTKKEVTVLRNKMIFFGQHIMLNIFDLSARLSSNENTTKGLSSLNCNNSLSNEIMKIMIYENSVQTYEMSKAMLDLLNRNSKNKQLISLVGIILRKHRIYNEIKINKEVQSNIDRINNIITNSQGKGKKKYNFLSNSKRKKKK